MKSARPYSVACEMLMHVLRSKHVLPPSPRWRGPPVSYLLSNASGKLCETDYFALRPP